MDIYIYISYLCVRMKQRSQTVAGFEMAVIQYSSLASWAASPRLCCFHLVKAYSGLSSSTLWLPSNGTCILKVLGCTQPWSFEQIKSPPSLNSIDQPVSSALNFP